MKTGLLTAEQIYTLRQGITSLLEAEGSNSPHFKKLAELELLLVEQYQLMKGIN